jgi:hypothetical protein
MKPATLRGRPRSPEPKKVPNEIVTNVTDSAATPV